MKSRSMILALSALVSISCKGIDEVSSQLTMLPPNPVSVKCSKKSGKHLSSLSAVRLNGWTRITLKDDACAKDSSRGKSFGLQNNDQKKQHGVTIMAFPFESDTRIPNNIQRMIQLEEQLGNHVIPVYNPRPGDIRNAISGFAVGHPEVRDASRMNVVIHGHGTATGHQEVRAPMAIPENAVFDENNIPHAPTDTIVGDYYTPNNMVELPSQFEFSAKDVTREALVTARQAGISGDNTTCSMVLGTCQAGGAIGSMQSNWAAWDKLGLDAAIGASNSNESSFDNPALPRSLPSENLLGNYYGMLAGGAVPMMDKNNDGVVAMGEMKESMPFLTSVHSSGLVLGENPAPVVPPDHQTIDVNNQELFRVPYVDVPISHQTETKGQKLIYAGNEQTPLFNVQNLSTPGPAPTGFPEMSSPSIPEAPLEPQVQQDSGSLSPLGE